MVLGGLKEDLGGVFNSIGNLKDGFGVRSIRVFTQFFVGSLL